MLARMNFAAALAQNQRTRLAASAAVARTSPQALLSYLLTRFTPADLQAATLNDLTAYSGAGLTWTGSDAQLQAKSSGLAHLILGSPEYQFV
jgi:hypothetical protein